MRVGWSILPGPFRVSGTVWRSKRRSRSRRAPSWHGTLPGGWGGKGTCPHNHQREDLATACAQREARRRVR
jgi:hypothetical protein